MAEEGFIHGWLATIQPNTRKVVDAITVVHVDKPDEFLASCKKVRDLKSKWDGLAVIPTKVRTSNGKAEYQLMSTVRGSSTERTWQLSSSGNNVILEEFIGEPKSTQLWSCSRSKRSKKFRIVTADGKYCLCHNGSQKPLVVENYNEKNAPRNSRWRISSREPSR